MITVLIISNIIIPIIICAVTSNHFSFKIDDLVDKNKELGQTNNKLADYVLAAQKENLLLPEECGNLLPEQKNGDPVDNLLDDLEKKDLEIIKNEKVRERFFSYLTDEVKIETTDIDNLELYLENKGIGVGAKSNKKQRKKIKKIYQKAFANSVVKSLRL